MNYETQWAIGDRLWCDSLETWVYVNAISIGQGGAASYSIAYFHNGSRQTCYVFADELRREK